MNDSRFPFISVILPVFNNAKGLARCLDALEKQTYPVSHYEVIVIEGSKNSPEELVSQFSHAKYIYEEKPGPYVARNRGLSLAHGEFIALTDSDCMPLPDWLEKGVRTFQETPNCGLVAGTIELLFAKPNAPSAVELYQVIRFFQQQVYAEERHFGATANVFTHKSVIEKAGPFNDALIATGDKEWGVRVFKAGYKVIYSDAPRVQHPARNFYDVARKSIRHVKGHLDIGEESNPQGVHLIKQLVPSSDKILKLVRDPRLSGGNQRIKVVCIFAMMFYLRCIAKTFFRKRAFRGYWP